MGNVKIINSVNDGKFIMKLLLTVPILPVEVKITKILLEF